MTDHNRIKLLLSAYLDGELSDFEIAEVKAHLLECDECAGRLYDYEVMSGLLSASEAELPADLSDRIMSTVRSEQSKSDFARESGKEAQSNKAKKRRFSFGTCTAVAAVAALVLLRASGTLDGWFGANNENTVQYSTVQNADMIQTIEEDAEFTTYAAIDAAIAEEVPAPAESAESDTGANQEAPASAGRSSMIQAYSISGQQADEAAPEQGSGEAALYSGEGILESGETDDVDTVEPENSGTSFTIVAVIDSVDYGDMILLNVRPEQDGWLISEDVPIVVSNSLAEDASDILYAGNTIKVTVVISESEESYIAISITDE